MIWFYLLEQKVTKNYTPIKIGLDDLIPFNEWFAIPYFLWFFYIFITMVYFFFQSKEEFYKVTAFLFLGMTICLIIYTIWPNGQNLRPDLSQLGRDNILIRWIAKLYGTDTSTNVCPSIHVFNSIGAHIAIHRSQSLKKYKWLQISSFILMILICLSTMFLKQHSSFDVIAGIALAIVMYFLIYALGDSKLSSQDSKKEKVYAQ
jgi:membrane-associated phospholipid phosphatase